jgi:hypothetical protein
MRQRRGEYMVYRDGWEKSEERYAAFWNGEIVDRCCCSVTAPRSKPIIACPPKRSPRDLGQKWLDPEFRLEQALHTFAHTYYGGDAYPMAWVNLGPGVTAAFVGAQFRLAEETVWFDADPPVKEWASRPSFHLDTDSLMWKTAKAITDIYSERACGNFLVGITDLGGNMDIVASLRGSGRLLYDLYDYPDEIKALIGETDLAWRQAYEILQGRIEESQRGSSAWMGIWCPERWFPLQCDFSAMISRKMFDEFVRPALAAEAAWFNRVIYHLDGPGEICHLESILEIKGIDGIQCVPGTMFQRRTGECYQSFCNELWIPVMKRIQDKGKLLVLNEVHPVELDELMNNLKPEGLFISMACTTVEEATGILKKIEKWK